MASIGHEGLNNLLAAYEDKSAQAVATFGFSRGPGHEPILFQGRTDVRSMPRCRSATFSVGPGSVVVWVLTSSGK